MRSDPDFPQASSAVRPHCLERVFACTPVARLALPFPVRRPHLARLPSGRETHQEALKVRLLRGWERSYALIGEADELLLRVADLLEQPQRIERSERFLQHRGIGAGVPGKASSRAHGVCGAS